MTNYLIGMGLVLLGISFGVFLEALLSFIGDRNARDDAYKEGYFLGKSDGYAAGHEAGYKAGRKNGLNLADAILSADREDINK